jgi:signal transduction histidine kinase/CheY-like chemotaxis protein
MATVLVVDDRQSNRDLVCTVLGYHGHNSIEADGAEQALAILRETPTDLVITDILMPGMDGYELVREIRADPATEAIPVVFYTANYLEAEARPIADAFGVTRIVAKTGDVAELLSAVDDALNSAPAVPLHLVVANDAPLADTAFTREHLEVVKAKLLERTHELEDRRRVERVIDAALAIGEDLSLSTTLDRLVSAAKSLVHAETAVVEVIEDDGVVSQVVPAGAPASGEGLAVNLETDGRRYGTLRVAGRDDGAQFDDEDREMLAALAGAAGQAIRNAKLYDDSTRREAWLSASADITSTLLGADPSEALALVAAGARRLARADVAWIEVAHDAGADTFVSIDACDGKLAHKMLHETMPSGSAPLYGAVESGRQPIVIGDADADPRTLGSLPVDVLDVGPLLAVPLLATDRCLGALLIGRSPKQARFSLVEVQMATAFAGQAALSLEFAQALADRERLTVSEDRERIARDLHDIVIQRLFATGLRLDSLRARLSAADSELVGMAAGDLDETIREIRTTIFSLRSDAEQSGLRAELLKLVARARETLGFHPRMHLEGPIDYAADDRVQVNLVAAVSEALSNASRHAGASRVEIVVRAADGQLLAQISDDGVGVAADPEESGLANLRRRAVELGGSMEMGPGLDGRGLTLTWIVPTA